jgi:hypothetical protein
MKSDHSGRILNILLERQKNKTNWTAFSPSEQLGIAVTQTEIEMKKIILAVLTSLILLPYASFAQEREHDETIRVMHSTNLNQYEDYLVDCAWAIPYLPMDVGGGWTSDLYSMNTNAGGVVTEDGTKIGEMWTCYDMGVDVTDTAGDVHWEQTIAFAMFIDDELLGALGTVRAWGGFETHGLYTAYAGVSRIVDNVPEDYLGTMTVLDLFTSGDLYGGDTSIVTLRLYAERDLDKEAAEKAAEDAITEILKSDFFAK